LVSNSSVIRVTWRCLKNGTLKTYADFPHGFPHVMPTTHAETINADVLAFLTT
jgi:non-heme chloroperoxidase